MGNGTDATLAPTASVDVTSTGAPLPNELALLVALNLVCLLLTSARSKLNLVPWLPDQGVTMIVGLLVGFLVRVSDPANDLVVSIASRFSGLFFEFFLPPIIFSAAYSLRRRDFFRNLFSILTLAVFGTVLSTFAIGTLLHRAVVAQWVALPLGPLDCMIVGAILSAVDPVATISVLRRSNIDRHLNALLLGESVLNDAVAIVVYNMLLAHRKTVDAATSEMFPVHDALQLFAGFLSVCLGSLLLGLGLALTSALAIRYGCDRNQPSMEQSIMLLFAYLAYLLARMSGLSPVMCLFINGVAMSHYTFYSLSPESQVSTSFMFRSIAHLTETFVFVFLGFAVTCMPTTYWNGRLAVILIVLCVACRALQIVVLSSLINTIKLATSWCLGKTRTPLISFRAQIMLTWSGLRGAVAFALALHAPVVGHTGFLVSTTMCIVLFTFFVQGSTSRWVATRLKLLGTDADISFERVPIDDPDAPYRDPKSSQPGASSQSQRAHAESKTYWRRFDDAFMKPIFGGKGAGTDLAVETAPLLFRRFLPRFHSFLGGGSAVADDEVASNISDNNIDLKFGGASSSQEIDEHTASSYGNYGATA